MQGRIFFQCVEVLNFKQAFLLKRKKRLSVMRSRQKLAQDARQFLTIKPKIATR